ncbi:response regulator [Candidatus Dojkabacteria bacterium]|nr:response regulator [Candidatus Dojkabacteria bacterium]
MNKAPRYKLFLIDSDVALCEFLKDELASDGFQVEFVSKAVDALEKIDKSEYDVVLMELSLPVLKGRTALKKVMKRAPEAVVIVLTNKSSTDVAVKAFELGVSDYINKPFDYKMLLARINARLKSNNADSSSSSGAASREDVLKYKDIRLDRPKKHAYKGDKRLLLSHREYELLKFFMKNQGRVLSRSLILDRVWGMENFVDTRSVDVYVGRLRKKLGKDDDGYLKTRRGFGYVLD